jgi:vesicle coat complex subunit
MLELLDAPTSTVVYEAATSLTALTSNPVAVKASAAKLIELAIREADNNVKLIVLDRVDQLRIRNEGVLEDLTMEILRVLSSPDIDVRRKALGIALEMVSSKNVEEIVMLLKKELAKTVDEQYEQVCFDGRVNSGTILTIRRTVNTANSSFNQYTLVPSSFLRSPLAWLTCLWTSLLTLTTTPPSMSSHSLRRSLRSSLTCVGLSLIAWCRL